MTLSLSEINFIKKYRTLNERGKEAVDMILDQPNESVIVVVNPKTSE